MRTRFSCAAAGSENESETAAAAAATASLRIVMTVLPLRFVEGDRPAPVGTFGSAILRREAPLGTGARD